MSETCEEDPEGIFGGLISVGYGGSGTLDIVNGGTVTSGFGYIAAQTGSSGAVTIDGSDSKWIMGNTCLYSRLFVGGSFDGDGGTGLLTVADGGSVTINNTTDAAHLVVRKSGTVTGNGSIMLNYGRNRVMAVAGTIAPTGTFTIDGNFFLTSTATTECNVTPTANDKVEVSSGVAALDGHLSVTMTGDFSSAPTQYILLHASGGLFNYSRFFSVSIKYSPGYGWHPTITYNDANGYVYLNRIFDLHP